MKKSALVLFSGGQDSTTCLAYALEKYERVETFSLDYRQRHSVELQCRLVILEKIRQQFSEWSEKLKDDHLVDFALLSELGRTAMTHDVAIEWEANGLPNTFVPGRNLLFLTMAAATAYRRNLDVIITGVCETDYSGYPDCRDDTMKALQVAINLGMKKNFVIETPLMWLDKMQTWEFAQSLGGAALVDIIRESSHTCYLGDRSIKHDWGYGCSNCPACQLRANGYERFIAKQAMR